MTTQLQGMPNLQRIIERLQPGSQMPAIPLDAAGQEQLRQFVIELRRQIEAGEVQPAYNYYRMEKISK